MDSMILFNKASHILKKNSPSILTGLGVAGLITTVIMAVYATPKAIAAIEEEDRKQLEEYGSDDDVFFPMSVPEVIKCTWKFYVPSAIMGAATIACIVGSNSVNMRRNSALAALFSLTETAAREYREKVKEIVGEKKAQEIQDEVAQDVIDKKPLKDNSIIITGAGSILCYDILSGRYFTSDINKIKKIENEYNRRLLRNMWLSLNDLYEELGLEETKMGDDLGWVVEIPLEFRFSSRLTPDGEPCLVIDYVSAPRAI